MFQKHLNLSPPWLEWAGMGLLGAGLMCWMGPQVWIFQGNLPITPQSLLMVLWGVLWGGPIGLLASALYLIAGGLGLPVFADGAHGWEHFMGTTGGFLLAFPIASWVVGTLASSLTRWKYGTATLLLLGGQGLIVGLGLLWQRGIVPVETSWMDTLARLMPAILVKTALGAIVVVFVGRLLTKHEVES